MMCKIQQAMQDDSIQAASVHPAIHPGNRAEVIWQNFSPLTKIPVGKTEIWGTEPARPLIIMKTSKILLRI